MVKTLERGLTEQQRRKQAALKGRLKRAQSAREKTGPQRPLAKLVETEKKLEKERASGLGKFRKGLANTFGKAVYKLKGLELHKKVAEHGKFVGGAASGLGLALAGKGASKLKEHVWPKNQFDKIIWVGIFYYAFQWAYQLTVGDIFSKIPMQFIILNFVIAMFVFILFFKPDLIQIIGTGLIISLYMLIMNTGFTFDIAFIPGGEVGITVSLVAITLLIAFIFHNILHKETSGMIGISIVFLLETGLKVFLASQAPALFTGLLLYWPYWLTLGAVAGSYTVETSRLAGFMRFLLFLIAISLVLVNVITGGTFYGATQFDISDEKKEAGIESLKENWKNIGETWKRLAAPFTCIGEIDYQKCISEKTKPPEKKPTEEEELLATANKEKPRRINLYFVDTNQQYFTANEKVSISTQLKGKSTTTNPKDILLGCSVNEISGTITKPEKETKIKGEDSNFYQDIECEPNIQLKAGKHEVEFLAKWRQLATTSYPNYFMDQEELDNLLGDYRESGEYSIEEQKCQNSPDTKKCLSVLMTSIYSKISKFNSIQSDYPNFERRSKYDDEVAAILIENTAFDIVTGVPQEGGTFNLKFSVANNHRNKNGEITKVNDVFIGFPDKFADKIEKNCDFLIENDGVEEDIKKVYPYKIDNKKLDSIEWEKVKFEKQKIIGSCEWVIKDVGLFITRINIIGQIDFDYQLKNDIEVMVYS